MEESDNQDQLENDLKALVEALNATIQQGLISSSCLPVLGSGSELYNLNPKYVAITKNFRTRLFTLTKILLNDRGCSAGKQLSKMSEFFPVNDFLLDNAAIRMDKHEEEEIKQKMRKVHKTI